MTKHPVSVKWVDGRQFVGTDSGRHSIVISSHDEANHTGVRPSDLLLLALASCSGYDVVSILEKKRTALRDMLIEVDAVQDSEPPWTFRQIQLKFRLDGAGLSEKAVAQAIELSLSNYCSVASTLAGTAEITYTFEIAS